MKLKKVSVLSVSDHKREVPELLVLMLTIATILVWYGHYYVMPATKALGFLKIILNASNKQ